MRIGQGYDIHRIKPGQQKPLKVGGIVVDEYRESVSHSDGDALLHAIIDAILGAAGMGDIGMHFPSTDDQFKNADSMELLKQVQMLIEPHGLKIYNIDATVVLEKPVLGRKTRQMAAGIAKNLGLKPLTVNIKAKTNEGLGDVGAGHAIECHAVVLLEETGVSPHSAVKDHHARATRPDEEKPGGKRSGTKTDHRRAFEPSDASASIQPDSPDHAEPVSPGRPSFLRPQTPIPGRHAATPFQHPAPEPAQQPEQPDIQPAQPAHPAQSAPPAKPVRQPIAPPPETPTQPPAAPMAPPRGVTGAHIPIQGDSRDDSAPEQPAHKPSLRDRLKGHGTAGPGRSPGGKPDDRDK